MIIDRLRRMAKLGVLRVLHRQDESRSRALYGGQRAIPLHHWSLSSSNDGHLMIGGCDVVDLAQRFGTPLHIVNEQALVHTFQAFRDTFLRHLPKVDIGYSYKTNPLPGVLATLHKAGASAEVISHFELWLALKLGMPSERIIFNGPAKTPDALALAVSRQVKLINIDNSNEIPTIHKLAQDVGVQQKVGVRIVPSVGWSGQFGFNIQSGAARAAFQQIKQFDRLIPCGIHVHLGTGIKNLEIYTTALKEALEFAKLIERELGVRMEFLDFGGGFGVATVKPYSENDMHLMANGFPRTVLDVKAHPPVDTYARALGSLISDYYSPQQEDFPTLILEPGRAITSSAQTLLLGVLATKKRPGHRDALIIDGGKNINLPTAYERHEVIAASNLKGTPDQCYDIYGPLCHPADMLINSIDMPVMAQGDLVAVMDAGAYFIPNQTNFSNPRPAAVMVKDGTATIIRERESFDDIVARDRFS